MISFYQTKSRTETDMLNNVPPTDTSPKTFPSKIPTATTFLLRGPRIKLTNDLSREIMATAGFNFQEYCEITDSKPLCFSHKPTKEGTGSNSTETPQVIDIQPKKKIEKKSRKYHKKYSTGFWKFLTESEFMHKSIMKYNLKPVTKKKKNRLILAVRSILKYSPQLDLIKRKFGEDDHHRKFIMDFLSLKRKKKQLNREFKDYVEEIERDFTLIGRYLDNVPTRRWR